MSLDSSTLKRRYLDCAQTVSLRRWFWDRLVPLVILVWLFGCAASGELFKSVQPDPGMSLIYIYHVYNSLAGFPSGENICLDGNTILTLPGGGYYFVSVPPGEHLVSIRSPFRREIITRVLTSDEKPSYVRVRKEVELYVFVKTWKIYIEAVDESVGRIEISQTRLQQP